MDDLILVLDAGTGGGRAVAVDVTGQVRARAYTPWVYFEPPGVEFYGREFRAGEFQAILTACCRKVVAETGAQAIKGVTTTAMRQGCVFLDQAGEPVYAGPNRDVRGILYTDEVEELLGEERAYNITGRWPPWMFAPCRHYWFKKERPELAQTFGRLLMINDWMIHFLAGRGVAEPTNATETMLFDLKSGTWSRDLLESMGIAEGLMPEVQPCGTVVGEVTAAAAKETGLAAGTPVITGMADTQAALLAGAVTEPGETGIVAGSTAPVMMVMDEPKLDPERRLWIGCHPFPGRWLAESNAGDAGLIVRWYVENHLGVLAPSADDAYRTAERLAAEVPAGANGARAFLGPVIWDLTRMTPSVRAGIFFPYPISLENSGPGNVVRAILENIAFALRANLEQAKTVAGEPGRMVISGGMTRSRGFCRIVASMLGKELEAVREPEATALGCAITGFFALKHYPTLQSAAAAMKGEVEVIESDPAEHDEYNDLYEQWREEYDRMMGLAEE